MKKVRVEGLVESESSYEDGQTERNRARIVYACDHS